MVEYLQPQSSVKLLQLTRLNISISNELVKVKVFVNYLPGAVFLLVLVSKADILCLHELRSSFLEFKLHRPDLKQIKYFSLVHSWHIPVTCENGWALAIIFQLSLYGIFSSFNSQIYLLSVVSFFLFSCLNEPLYISIYNVHQLLIEKVHGHVVVN